MTKKVDIIVGLQYGSEGKGLIAGHLAQNYDTVVNVNMPNAGHTYIDNKGKEYIFKVLPNGAVWDQVERVMIGPDSVFSLERLVEEIAMIGGFDWSKLMIHENAVLLQPDHIKMEEGLMNRIGSTAQGSSAAMIHKITREPDAVIKSDPHLLWKNVVTHDDWMKELNDAEHILLEGCQGYSLGLNAGFYPYCTSRDCTPARLLAGAGIPYQWARNVIGAARTYPIRVGGNSGPSYADSAELRWEDLDLTPEKTTVTKRNRRIFEFSRLQMKAAVIACQPDQVFLNFCNYNPELSKEILNATNIILRQFGPSGSKVAFTGWGPKDNDIRYE